MRSMAKAHAIPEVLEEHFESFALLWCLWCDARVSPDYRLPGLGALEARMEAHLDGLRVVGEDGRSLALERLTGDDPAESFAAACALLDSGATADLDAVVDAFLLAEAELLDALRDALRIAVSAAVVARLRPLLTATSGIRSAVVLEVLAAAGELDSSAPRLLELLVDPDASVRAAAWRAAGIVDSGSVRRAPSERDLQQR